MYDMPLEGTEDRGAKETKSSPVTSQTSTEHKHNNENETLLVGEYSVPNKLTNINVLNYFFA